MEKPWDEPGIGHLTFDNIRRAGDIALEVEGLSVTGLFEGLTFHPRRGDRLAITGANGSGKTTLLKLLAGQRRPDAGSIRLGSHVEAASIEQALEQQLDFCQSPLQTCGTSSAARTLLACLRVPVGCLHRPHSTANLLLLDEPTNLSGNRSTRIPGKGAAIVSRHGDRRVA